MMAEARPPMKGRIQRDGQRPEPPGTVGTVPAYPVFPCKSYGSIVARTIGTETLRPLTLRYSVVSSISCWVACGVVLEQLVNCFVAFSVDPLLLKLSPRVFSVAPTRVSSWREHPSLKLISHIVTRKAPSPSNQLLVTRCTGETIVMGTWSPKLTQVQSVYIASRSSSKRPRPLPTEFYGACP